MVRFLPKLSEMEKIKLPQNIHQEAKFLKNMRLTYDLLEVFMGEKKGTLKQRKRVYQIFRKLRENIFIEAVYLLTHTIMAHTSEAKKTYNNILKHRNSMVVLLRRHVSIQVAALDYMQNIKTILKRPTIIEADKCREFASKAITDETTRLYDRSLLDYDLECEIENAGRPNKPLSLMFVDIDDLKGLNDKWGHEAGTKTIKYVSGCIKRVLRDYDSIYRYGGDEFVVLLPGTRAVQAARIANRIRFKIRHRPAKGVPTSPGISIGIAEYNGKGRIKGREALLAAADNALYQAKQNGKNRTCVFSPDKNDNKQ